jgi:hypothetical protein
VQLRNVPQIGGDSGLLWSITKGISGSNVASLAVVDCNLQDKDVTAVLSILRAHQLKRDEVIQKLYPYTHSSHVYTPSYSPSCYLTSICMCCIYIYINYTRFKHRNCGRLTFEAILVYPRTVSDLSLIRYEDR